MQKFLVLTDLHLTDVGETIIGLDPSARLFRVLDHALRHHPDARGLILLGDLTHHGRPAQYDRLRDVLKACPLPVHATIGNHDRRKAAQAACVGWMPERGFCQHTLGTGSHRILVLDSVDEDGKAPKHGGFLCPERLEWLRAQLARAQEPQIVVALHHPPVETGFPGMDRIALANGDELLALLQRDGRPVHVVAGHVHRTISGLTRGIGWSILKSPCHQMPMLLGEGGSDHSVDEPGGYGILCLTASATILHNVDVLETDAPVIADMDSA